jgi:hypothetical protein
MSDLASERERLEREVARAERAMLTAGLRDREAFNRAWQVRRDALSEPQPLPEGPISRPFFVSLSLAHFRTMAIWYGC